MACTSTSVVAVPGEPETASLLEACATAGQGSLALPVRLYIFYLLAEYKSKYGSFDDSLRPLSESLVFQGSRVCLDDRLMKGNIGKYY
jgi:hypothetical protein